MSEVAQSPYAQMIKRWWLSLDRVSFALLIALALFGVMTVGTASPSVAIRIDKESNFFLIRHAFYLVPAIICMVGVSFLSLKHIRYFATILLIMAMTGVVWSLIAGAEIKGATRWIRVFGFSIQPSEFLKPAFIILSAWFLSRQKLQANFPGIMIAFTLYCLTTILFLLQPDFGMFFLISCVFAIQIFLSGCPLRLIAVIGLIGVSGVGMAYLSLDHVQSRIDRFLFPEGADTYQVDRSKQAFMNGGLIGTGLGQGEIKTSVPDVHSDFIFTAIGEEWGFIISAMIIGIFGTLFYRFFTNFARSDSLFLMLGGGGLTFMLAVQCFIHMGSTLQLIPAKGMTLPLISYGGSSLVAIGITLGLILALSRSVNQDARRGGWRHLTRKEL